MLKRVISGGQTGVDRAALDAAIENNFPRGGWCPAGRIAEDGVIPPIYPLKETRSREYEERTEKNVIDSDGTLIITAGEPSGGTALTVKFAEKHKKPCLVIDLEKADNKSIPGIISWLRAEKIEVLNAAGPRASKNPEIYPAAKRIIAGVLRGITGRAS